MNKQLTACERDGHDYQLHSKDSLFVRNRRAYYLCPKCGEGISRWL